MNGFKFKFSKTAWYIHVIWALGASLVVVVLVLAILAAPPASAAEVVGYALAVVAVVALSSVAAGVLAALWPLPWLVGYLRPPLVNPDELSTPSMRVLFGQALAYYKGIERMASSTRDRQTRRLLGQVARDIRAPIGNMFDLARQVEAFREDRLLESDLIRLRVKAEGEGLTEAEQEQLASLQRLDEVASTGERLVREMLAVLGGCYAQSQEVVMVRDVQGAGPQQAAESLREQALQLDHLRAALRQVYVLPAGPEDGRDQQ